MSVLVSDMVVVAVAADAADGVVINFSGTADNADAVVALNDTSGDVVVVEEEEEDKNAHELCDKNPTTTTYRTKTQQSREEKEEGCLIQPEMG